jgi:hypothetical protein
MPAHPSPPRAHLQHPPLHHFKQNLLTGLRRRRRKVLRQPQLHRSSILQSIWWWRRAWGRYRSSHGGRRNLTVLTKGRIAKRRENNKEKRNSGMKLTIALIAIGASKYGETKLIWILPLLNSFVSRCPISSGIAGFSATWIIPGLPVIRRSMPQRQGRTADHFRYADL